MASNTKITADSKAAVRAWIKSNPDTEFFNNGKVTVLVRPEFKNSRMYIVSFSTMSPDEIKFRKSVGVYYTICNMENGNYVLMDYDTIWNTLDNLLMLTDSSF